MTVRREVRTALGLDDLRQPTHPQKRRSGRVQLRPPAFSAALSPEFPAAAADRVLQSASAGTLPGPSGTRNSLSFNYLQNEQQFAGPMLHAYFFPRLRPFVLGAHRPMPPVRDPDQRPLVGGAISFGFDPLLAAAVYCAGDYEREAREVS